MPKKRVTLRVEETVWDVVETRAAQKREPARTVGATLFERAVLEEASPVLPQTTAQSDELETLLRDVRRRLIQLQMFLLREVPKEQQRALAKRAAEYAARPLKGEGD